VLDVDVPADSGGGLDALARYRGQRGAGRRRRAGPHGLRVRPGGTRCTVGWPARFGPVIDGGR